MSAAEVALIDVEETAIVAAYKALKKHGLEFGRLCYNFRKRSEVVQGGTTFCDTLARLDIPKSTAYYWIARYEESLGERPAPKKPIQPAVGENVNSSLRSEPIELKEGMLVRVAGKVYTLGNRQEVFPLRSSDNQLVLTIDVNLATPALHYDINKRHVSI